MIENKIKTKDELKTISDLLKKQKKTVVFTNGCFDLLHYGHVKYLEDSKKQGDVLIVGLNSDESVRKIKGSPRPVISQDDRLRILAALESVDYVTTFNETTPLEIIKYLMPNVLVKGSDWDKKKIVGADLISKAGGKVITVPFVNGKSSSNIIDKIRNTVLK